MTPETLILYLGAYLLGAVPTAYLFVRLVIGEDIRALGTGNVGAKNTYESVSHWGGFSVAGIDIFKGWLVITGARQLGFPENTILLAGAALILGHDFSIFLNFQGGQGMAATLGIFLALFPMETMIAFLVFLVVLALSRNWDISCGAGFFLLVLGIWIAGYPKQQVLFTLLILPWIAVSKFVHNRHKHRLAV